MSVKELENLANQEFKHFLLARKGEKIDNSEGPGHRKFEMEYKILSPNGLKINGRIVIKSEEYPLEKIKEYIINASLGLGDSAFGCLEGRLKLKRERNFYFACGNNQRFYSCLVKDLKKIDKVIGLYS